MTTTATALSPTEVRRVVADHLAARGMGPEALGGDRFARLVEEGAAGVLRFERFRLSHAARAGRRRALRAVPA